MWVSLGALLVAGAVAAVLIFSQVAPPVATATIASNCANLVSTPAFVLVGSSGFVTFDCGGVAAFRAQGGSGTPTFALPTGYASLWLYSSSTPPAPGTSCSNTGFQITSGTSVGFGTDNMDYCAMYSAAPAGGLGTFTGSWSQ